MRKILILKDNYNSFEQFYIDQFNDLGFNCQYYYNSSRSIRKFFTHFGLPFEHMFYGKWKKNIKGYDIIIVFDSLHTSNLLKYIKSNTRARIIYWHWNPVKTKKDINIFRETNTFCEHWTFNPADSDRFGMKLNNQFFFFQNKINTAKYNRAFFVGTDKGRYNTLLDIANQIKYFQIKDDFYVIDEIKKGCYYQKEYMDYSDVIEKLKTSKFVVEIVQDGQSGLTARTLEAMFFNAKLITNNVSVKECSFYNPNNIFVLGDEDFQSFLSTPFEAISKEKLFDYSAQGWISDFCKGEEQ